MIAFEPKPPARRRALCRPEGGRLGKIRAARLSGSPRLRRSLRLLISASARGEKITTLEWQARAYTCNAHTARAELKANGIVTQHEQQARLHYYWIKATDLPAARQKLIESEAGN